MSDAPSDGENGSDEPAQHWFARREQTPLLYYKVNRRPFPQQPLSTGQAFPEDVFDHITECLLFGDDVETGRAKKRTWVLGNRSIEVENRLLTGQIGFRRDPQVEAGDRFDESEQSWVDHPVETEGTARAPFVFDADTRILAVLKHPDFPDGTVQNVFTTLLNRGEQNRDTPAVEWDVAGTLDEPDFWEWVQTADAVLEVTVNVKLPNPEGSPEFDPLLQRLEAREAAAIRDTIRAADPDRGLQRLDEDEYVRAGVRMASRGYATVTGSRRWRGGDDTFDPERTIDRDALSDLPDSWPSLIAYLLRWMLSRRDQA